MATIAPRDRLMVALDFSDVEAAAACVAQLGPSVTFYKIGLELAMAGGLDQPGARALWRTAADHGMVVNVVAGREHAGDIAALLHEFPDTTTVIEHSLSIQVADDRAATLRDLVDLARYPNAVAEICDLPLLSQGPYPFDDAFPTILEIVNAFGPERCVWGSSFPVEFWMPKTTYREALEAIRTELPVTKAARDHIVGLTALRLWFSDSPSNASVAGAA